MSVGHWDLECSSSFELTLFFGGLGEKNNHRCDDSISHSLLFVSTVSLAELHHYETISPAHVN